MYLFIKMLYKQSIHSNVFFLYVIWCFVGQTVSEVNIKFTPWHWQIMFTLCACVVFLKKRKTLTLALGELGNWFECPCEFLYISKRAERERKGLFLVFANKPWGRNDPVRVEGIISLNEWPRNWHCENAFTGKVHVILAKSTDHPVWRHQCGAKPYDLPPRQAIVFQQVPLFSNYHQDQLTRNTLSHHKMPVKETSARKQDQKEFNYNRTFVTEEKKRKKE